MRKYIEQLLFLLFLLVLSWFLVSVLYQKAAADALTKQKAVSEEFRNIRCSELFLERLISIEAESYLKPSEILTVLTPQKSEGIFQFPDSCTVSCLLKWKEILQKYNRDGYEKVQKLYSAIWDDLCSFPVELKIGAVYENSWMFERYYGGKRGHEGTDLIPPQNISGYYPIQSVTDGVVEQIGWLPKGGYRIGIRSPHGGYFYYAHLDSYSASYQIGDYVEAGEIIGFMGDTGYGKEGTRGQFPVHLHFGIYIQTDEFEEISVNPYWILRYLELRTQRTAA